MTPDDWLKLVTGTGLGVACMLMGIRWLVRDRGDLLQNLNRERSERIAALENAASACREDRVALHNQVNELQREVRQLLTQMIEFTRDPTNHDEAH